MASDNQKSPPLRAELVQAHQRITELESLERKCQVVETELSAAK